MKGQARTTGKGPATGLGRALGDALDRLIELMAITAGVLLVALTVLTFVAVLTRNLMGRPLAWSIEMTEFALLYITFLTAPWVLRRGGHVRIDLLVGRLRGGLRRILHVFAALVGIGVCAVLAYYGSVATYNAYERGLEMIHVLRVPRYLVLWVIPFGSIVLLLQFVRMLFHAEDTDLGSPLQEAESG